MSLSDAVVAAGPYPTSSASQAEKKRYSEKLSKALAEAVAAGLRDAGFRATKPDIGGPSEKEFQGGLGPKRVDVSYADERNGLLLAVSVKTITAPPFGKNLKNRFGDLCTEAISLHLRFPYSVVCALFSFPMAADADATRKGTRSTFRRARALFATISGRVEYTDPGEKFEHVALMLFTPSPGRDGTVELLLFDATADAQITEDVYFATLTAIYNRRNPHAPVGCGELE